MPPHPEYALFMFLAFFAFLFVRRLQPRNPADSVLPLAVRVRLGIAAFVGGAFGAKLPFALAGNLWTSAAWLSDGKTIMTGLMGAYIAVEVTKLFLGVKAKTGDAYALPLAVAIAVGRWGCFVNGCCYGTATRLPWGVEFRQRDGSMLLCHPTQAYESLFHLSMAFVLALLMRRRLLVHHRLKFYLIAYAGYRFLTEFIRPEPDWVLGLTFYQWAALIMAGGLIVQWVYDARRAGAIAGLNRRFA